MCQDTASSPFPCDSLHGSLLPGDEEWAQAAAAAAAHRFREEFRPHMRRLFIQPFLETVKMPMRVKTRAGKVYTRL